MASLVNDTFYSAGMAGIDLLKWSSFLGVIQELQEHNEAHFNHSLRVGLYAFGLAVNERQHDLHFPLFAGCGHDIGKCGIENTVLDHPNFGPKQMEEIKAHTFLGFEKLKDTYLFTGLVAGLHHKYQKNGYGIDLDTALRWPLSEKSKERIEEMAQFISLCDFFDAMTTRKTKFEGDVAEVMQEHFPHSKDRVQWLLKNRIQ